MKKKTTPILFSDSDKSKTKEYDKGPGRDVIKFLQLFARNCHIEPGLPEGLQEIIVG